MIVRPASTGELAAVLRVCHDARIGVVPQGGNTGYCGGATPDDGGRQLLLCLDRMDRIRSVDADDAAMTVEAGVVLANAQRAAEDAGLFFPLSLGAEGSCQVGGNLATNAGGIAVLRYGNARDLVLGLEVVLADGSVVGGLRRVRKDNAGYDLRHLFIGAEGTLGIITAAVLKLFPAPRSRQTVMLAVRDVAAATRLLGALRADSGDTVTSFEYLPRAALALVVNHIHGAADPFDRVHEHYVLAELSSSADIDLAAVLERRVAAGVEAGDVVDGVVATSEAQRSALWRLRETIPEAQVRDGGSHKHDVSVPTSTIADFIDEATAVVRSMAPDARIVAYGHLGDGNLHFNLQPPVGETLADFTARSGKAVSGAIYELVLKRGGSVCAEHGVGRLKRELLADTADPVALATMRLLKQALDPHGILNPGKVL